MGRHGLAMETEKTLIKLLSKVAVKRFMDKLTAELSKLDFDINHLSISKIAGKQDNALSKTLSEGEDPRLSSFLRYWYAISTISKKETGQETPILFEKLFDPEVKRILKMISDLGNPNPLFNEYKDTFKGWKVYVDLLAKQNAITQEEITAYNDFLSKLEK